MMTTVGDVGLGPVTYLIGGGGAVRQCDLYQHNSSRRSEREVDRGGEEGGGEKKMEVFNTDSLTNAPPTPSSSLHPFILLQVQLSHIIFSSAPFMSSFFAFFSCPPPLQQDRT